MRSIILSILVLFSFSALAQDTIPPPGVQFDLAELQFNGEIKAEATANGGVRESVEFSIEFTLGDSDGIDAPKEGLSIDYIAVPPNPCNLVAIPPGAFVPNNNGFELISTDPKLSGVQYLLTDGKGNVLADLTPNVLFLDARLRKVEGEEGAWRLVIEAQSQASADDPQWLPVSESRAAILTIGNDAGSLFSESAEFVHIWEPPGG